MSRMPDRDPAVRNEGAGGGRRTARGAVAAASATRRSRTVRSTSVSTTASGAGRRAAALQPEPPPLVVRVDEVGRAEVVDYLPEAVTPTSPETLFFIRPFVVDQYERHERRAAVVEDRWGRSFHFVSPSVADASSWSMPTR